LASRKLEDRIEQLRQLRTHAAAADANTTLRRALTDRSNLIVAEAAKTASELHLSELIPDLLTTFDRLFEEPVKIDPKCWGKTAIVKALARLDYSESQPFVRGSQHIQMEPVWGGQEDSAVQLRANSFLALVQCTDITRFEVLRQLVNAMSDPADPVRIEAVRAMHQLGGEECSLLLRLKARVGDRRPVIIGHVFDALLNMERDQAVPFVAEYLRSGDEALRDEAALALGASRLSGGLKELIETWKSIRSDGFSEILLRAISSSRLPEAIEFLLDLLRNGTARQSAAAAEALKLHEASPEIRTLIDEAKRNRSQAGA
jgi:HEAT repeat protein